MKIMSYNATCPEKVLSTLHILDHTQLPGSYDSTKHLNDLQTSNHEYNNKNKQGSSWFTVSVLLVNATLGITLLNIPILRIDR